MWSVRMRASRTVRRKPPGVKGEIHISGAEGLYEVDEIEKIARDYLRRAMNHPKGKPDSVVITMEEMRRVPLAAPLLPFSTVPCDFPAHASDVIKELLSASCISERAIRSAVRIVTGRSVMRGAALLRAESAVRADPDKRRGIRVSRLGIEEGSEKILSRRLAKEGINTPTVKEAMVLASKVASCSGVIAELCVSDDPHYTTGYVASRAFGYIRLPNIKQKGSASGGRVFFIDEDADVERIIEYLEETPVLAKIGTHPIF
jgi:6-carboxyhexanoate--CoA ligase